MRGPRYVRAVAQLLLPRGDREFIIGDLEELYATRVRDQGRGRATVAYLREAFVSVVARWRPVRGARSVRPPQMPRGRAWTGLTSDARTAVRALWHERGFAALTVLTLALGLGSTGAVFGMVNQLLLRPLPGADRSMDVGYLALRLAASPADPNGYGLTTQDFDELRRAASVFEGVATYGRSNLTLRMPGRRPIAVEASTVYGDYFEVLGVRPSEGRLLMGSETALGADALVAVISEPLRAKVFGPTDVVVGRKLMLNGHPVRILGVAGGRFRGAERGDEIDVWLPYGALVPLIGFSAERLRSRESTIHDQIVVRLRPGITASVAEAQVAAFLGRFAERNPEDAEYLGGIRPVLYEGLRSPPMWRARTYTTLRVLGGVVAVVLLIACANVANLMLVRNVKRRGALAMRRALGASTGRIARQGLVESLALATLGTLAGLVVAWLIALPFRGERLVRMPAFEGFTVDGRVLAFAAAASVLTALLFGTLPALLAGRFDLGSALKTAGARDTGRTALLRATLSVVQIALTFALVIGTILLTRTVRNLYAVDTGLAIDGVLALPLMLPRDLDESARDALERDLIANVSRVSDVSSVALDLYGPHGSSMMGRVGRPGTPAADLTEAQMIPVTPGWFEMFGVRPIHGRTFEPRDWRSGASSGLVLTASLARRLFGREDVTGQRLLAGLAEPEELEVLGVIGDIRMANTPDEPHDAFFMTYDAMPPFPMATLLARTRRADPAVANAVRAAVERVLAGEPIPDPTPLVNRVDNIHSEERIFSRLLQLLSALAVLLAAVGLYGVLAFTVAGRRREFGVRLALGARASRIATLVARTAITIVFAGVIVGLFGAFALSRILENRLFGIAPIDPPTYAMAALSLALVAALACLAPALVAMRVDPMITLRED